jgi:hypothetical protein
MRERAAESEMVGWAASTEVPSVAAALCHTRAFPAVPIPLQLVVGKANV